MNMLRGSAFAITLLLLGGLLLVLGLTTIDWRFPAHAYAAQSEPARLRTIFADNRLWLLTGDGLWSVSEDDANARRENAAGEVLDICRQRGDLVAVLASDTAGQWSLKRRNRDQWKEFARLSSRGNGFVALACSDTDMAVLTSGRVVRFSTDAGHREATLSSQIPNQPLNSVLLSGDQVFIGLNSGEWGGGLMRVNQKTGDVRRFESISKDADLCASILSSDCHPINGITPSPGKPGCTLAAIGLVHMLASGRLLEVCGDDVTVAYSEDCGTGSLPCTLPFFGLVTSNAAAIAVSPQSIVTLDASGTHSSSLPPFRSYPPFDVAFAPNYVLVKSSANQRHSLSGMTPMIAAR